MPEPTRRPPGPLEELPERPATGAEAIEVLRGLWPVLQSALEPGAAARAYTRRGDNQAQISPWCEVCGGRRYWREATSPHSGERLRPYCRRCDTTAVSMPTSPAAAAVGPLDVLVTAERTLLDVARAVQAVLRDVEPVIRIDARCPWCDTLALVMYPERGPTNGHNIAGLVVCTYPDCVCEDTACRCRRRGETNADGQRRFAGYRHRWTNTDWAWLSRRIDLNLYELARGENR